MVKQKIKIPFKNRWKTCTCGYEWLARTATPTKCPRCQKPFNADEKKETQP